MPEIPFDDRDGWIWLDGQFVPWREAKVHVLTHGLHYASAVFEGERMYGGEIFELTAHTERLFKSAEILDFEIPFTVAEIDQRVILSGSKAKRGVLNELLADAALERALTRVFERLKRDREGTHEARDPGGPLMREIQVRTRARRELVDITRQVAAAARDGVSHELVRIGGDLDKMDVLDQPVGEVAAHDHQRRA